MPTESNKIIAMVIELMNDKNISQTELAMRLHWPKSKLSKVLNGQQKLTSDDLYNLTAALGIANPAILMKADVSAIDDPFFHKGLIIDAFQELKDAEEYDEQREIVENKIVCIFSDYLSLASDGRRAIAKSNRMSFNFARKAIFEDRGEKLPIGWGIMVKDINPLVDRTNHITVGLYWNTDRSEICLAVVRKNFSDIDRETQELLRKIVDQKDNSWTIGGLAHGFPVIAKHSLICHKVFNISDVGDELEFKGELIKAYDLYSELVSEYMDRVVQGYIESKRKAEVEEKETSRKAAIYRKNNIAALKRSNYTCEISPDHVTFVNPKTGKQYMQAAHLIPIVNQDKVDGNLGDVANICCLCPNCAAKMQFGSDADRQEILTKLYLDHKNDLEKAGITVTLMQVFKMNGME